jgi:hypothetical protein
MPSDTIMCLLTARKDVIVERMKSDPHDYPVVPESDIDEMQEAFQFEYRRTWIKRKLTIDTSDLSADDLLPKFLTDSIPQLDERDLLIRSAMG